MLIELERLFAAGRETQYAAKLREVLAGGETELQKWLTSGDFWGGMGSMIDCAFCRPSGLGFDVDKRHRRAFMELIVMLGQHQLRSGIVQGGIKAHIKKWTTAFDGWLRKA